MESEHYENIIYTKSSKIIQIPFHFSNLNFKLSVTNTKNNEVILFAFVSTLTTASSEFDKLR